MLHAFPYSTQCTWTQSHEMLRFRPLSSRFSRSSSSLDYALSRTNNPSLGSGIGSRGTATRYLPSVMASLSTVSTQKVVESSPDESTQKIPQPPLQVLLYGKLESLPDFPSFCLVWNGTFEPFFKIFFRLWKINDIRRCKAELIAESFMAIPLKELDSKSIIQQKRI